MNKHISKPPPSVDFDLRQLEIFSKVVELASFSKAARAVSLAQASVSERIATLENMVGTKLLDRLGRKVVPTGAGELLYKHAVLLLDMKGTASLEMQEFLGLRRGEIQMGASTIPGEYILPGIIGHFKKKYPEVSVALTVADTGAIHRRVLDGDFELGVVGSRISHKALIFHELWEDELVLAVPGGHPWKKEKEVSVEQLCKEPFIFRESGSGTSKILESYLKEAGARGLEDLKPVATLGSSTAVKEGIKAGLGVSILSSRAIETELKTGLLKALRIRGLSMGRSFYLIRDKRRVASPLTRAMVDFLAKASAKEKKQHEGRLD